MSRASKNSMRLTQQSPSADLASLVVRSLGQFIPGYNIIIDLLRDRLGLDGDKLLALAGFLFGGWALANYVNQVVIPKILGSFTSSLILDEDDKVFEDFNKWLMKQRTFQVTRTIRLFGNKAHSNPNRQMMDVMRGRMVALNQKHRQDMELQPELDSGDENVIFNASASEALRPLRFEPDSGHRWFFHRRKLYLYRRSTRLAGQQAQGSGSIELSCLGLSTQPLKDLVEETRADTRQDRASWTNIFRAQGGAWGKLSGRIARPLHTIVMSREQKLAVIKDSNEFLRPACAQWYASRGIPYRRGYLFSGPPGTGKSSVSYALAGLYGLDIFIASLDDGKVGEMELESLMSALPQKCIVLLEDVDCAGAERTNDRTNNEEQAQASQRRWNPAIHQMPTKSLSLSGLLNAIDGVASHEGHLLIMTTNKPDELDPALKRPGRVDLHVEFRLATKAEIREIFVRIYSDESTKVGARTPKTTVTVQDVCRLPSEMMLERNCAFMSLEELNGAAEQFAGFFPDHTFSPAEIQGYLLAYKGVPGEAIDQVAAWIEAQERSKKPGVESSSIQDE